MGEGLGLGPGGDDFGDLFGAHADQLAENLTWMLPDPATTVWFDDRPLSLVGHAERMGAPPLGNTTKQWADTIHQEAEAIAEVEDRPVPDVVAMLRKVLTAPGGLLPPRREEVFRFPTPFGEAVVYRKVNWARGWRG